MEIGKNGFKNYGWRLKPFKVQGCHAPHVVYGGMKEKKMKNYMNVGTLLRYLVKTGKVYTDIDKLNSKSRKGGYEDEGIYQKGL